MGMELLQRATDLERRINRVETLLVVSDPKPPQPPALRSATYYQEKPASTVSAVAPEIQPAKPQPPKPPTLNAPNIPIEEPKVIPYAAPPPPPASSKDEPNEFEQTLGLRWAGWIGAIVLVIGMGLGVKFAYEQGWFGIVPNWARVMLMYFTSLSLVAAGEIVYRKINRISAVGLFAAGIAGLFLVSYAGHRFYNLYSPDAAFVLMAISTFIGAIVAARGDLVSIALLSLLGGNIVPLVIGSAHPRLVPFLSYLLMLQIVALLLAGRGGKEKWWLLRGFSLATTAMWINIVLQQGVTQTATLLTFVFIYAALFHVELLISTRNWIGRKTQSIGAAAHSLLVTAGALTAFLYVIDGRIPRGLITLAMASAILVLYLLLRRKQTNRDLATSYRIQSLALFAISIPIMLIGVQIVLAWSFFAIVLAALGRKQNDSFSAHAAVIAWALAVAKLFLWWTTPNARTIWLTLDGIGFSEFLFISTAVSVTGAILAQITSPALPHIRQAMRNFAMTLLIVTGTIEIDRLTSGRTMQLLWTSWWTLCLTSAGLAQHFIHTGIHPPLPLGEGRPVPSAAEGGEGRTTQNFESQVAPSKNIYALLLVIALKFIFIDAIAYTLFNGPIAGPLLANLQDITAALVIGSILLLHSLIEIPHRTRQLTTCLIAFIILVIGSIEIARSVAPHEMQVALSIYWAFFAVATIGLGFLRRSTPLRYFAMTLYGLTLLKVMAIDLAEVSHGYRILSFIGLGIVLLGTSVLYGKISPMLLAER